MQFLLHTFGEFMTEEQLNAVSSAVRYGAHGTVSYFSSNFNVILTLILTLILVLTLVLTLT